MFTIYTDQTLRSYTKYLSTTYLYTKPWRREYTVQLLLRKRKNYKNHNLCMFLRFLYAFVYIFILIITIVYMAARSPSPALDLLFFLTSTLHVRGRVRVPIYTRQNTEMDDNYMHIPLCLFYDCRNAYPYISGFRKCWQKSYSCIGF